MTLHDIATKVGVSRDTVSRVLNRGATYERPTFARRAEKIREIARELGYRPNTAAQAARNGRFQRVGLILPYHRGSYMPHEFLSGLTHRLAEHGYELASSELPAPDSDNQTPHLLQNRSVDGIINLLDTPTTRMRQVLERLDLPMTWVNIKMPHNCVHPDEIGSSQTLTRFLLSCGHRRIAFVSRSCTWLWRHEQADYSDPLAELQPRRVTTITRRTPRQIPEHFSQRDRAEGYVRAMRQAGLSPRTLAISGDDPDSEMTALRRLLQAPDRPTALITADADEALLTIRAAESIGLSVPGDISVTTFTWGQVYVSLLGLTGMFYHGPQLGSVTADLLAEQIDNKIPSPAPAKTVPGRLVIDRTVAKTDGMVPS